MERLERIAANPPPGIGVQKAGEKILNGIDIRGYIQSRHPEILGRIHDDRYLVVVQDLPETPDEFGCSCSAGENSNHGKGNWTGEDMKIMNWREALLSVRRRTRRIQQHRAE